MPIITGESSPTSAATQSRFVSINLSQEKRKGTIAQQTHNHSCLQRNSPYYHRIGRWILLNRKEFVTVVMKELSVFHQSREIEKAIPSARLRYTYGPAYAVVMAINSIFPHENYSSGNLEKGFHEYLINHLAQPSS